MKIIKELDIRQVGNRGYRFALFECPVCKNHIEKIKTDGLKSKQCSRKCYSKSRKGLKRGAYLDFVIISGYRYRYAPEHPKAIGTRKLYVAEHRLIMESIIGRFLEDNEIVHHKDENTLNNSPDNLKLMTISEHIKHHKQTAKRNENGQFTI